MAYTVIIKRPAEKELDRLPASIHQRITRKLLELENNARPPRVQKLHGHDGYRLRIGDYRILYLIDDSTRIVEVVAIGHRRDVYRWATGPRAFGPCPPIGRMQPPTSRI